MLKINILLIVLLSLLSFTGGAPYSTDIDSSDLGSAPITQDDELADTTYSSENCDVEVGQILLDSSGIIIKTQGATYDVSAPEIFVSIENTTDKDVVVQSNYVCINGLMTHGSLFVIAEANSTTTSSISFYDFVDYGIETVADIQVVFELVDYQSYASIYKSEITEIKTSLSGQYEQTFDTSGDILFEDTSFKVIYQGMSDIDSQNPAIHFYIENNTDNSISVCNTDMALQGTESDIWAMLWCDLLPHTKAYALFTLEDVNVLDLKQFSFELEIFDSVTYDTHIKIPIAADMTTDTPQLTAEAS